MPRAQSLRRLVNADRGCQSDQSISGRHLDDIGARAKKTSGIVEYSGYELQWHGYCTNSDDAWPNLPPTRSRITL